MSGEGRAVWRAIIRSKPADWFDADQLYALRDHCEHRVMLGELTRRLVGEDVGSKAFRDLSMTMKTISSVLTASARQLRLTVQHTIERHETKATERQGKASGDPLIGGATKLKRVA